MRVGVPAGECPVVLRGTDTETVLEWAAKVQSVFESRRQKLEVEGLIYFARHFYDINGPQYKVVRRCLLDHLCEDESHAV